MSMFPKVHIAGNWDIGALMIDQSFADIKDANMTVMIIACCLSMPRYKLFHAWKEINR